MKLTVAILLAAAYLGAQTGASLPGRKGESKLPGDPGVMHPLPVPKTTPDPVPPGTAREGTKSRTKSTKKKSSSAADGAGHSTTKKKQKTDSPKAKVETQP